MREEAERRRRAEQAQYVSTFCSRIAATQNASRPRTVALLKHYYVKYRAENPIARLSPGKLVYTLKLFVKVISVDFHTKRVEWLPKLSNYLTLFDNDRSRPIQPGSPLRRIQSSDSGGPSPTVGSAAVTSMTQADAALLNDPREVLESNKNGVTVTDVQQALIQELVQGRQGGGDGDDGDESVLDHDGAAFVPVSSRAIEVPIILRFMPSARLLPGEDPAARSRTLVRPPYLLVGHPGLSVELRPRSAARTGPISVELGKNLFFVMRIAPTHHGVVKDAVVFNFGSFVICRYVSLRVEDPAIKEDAKAHRAATPYTGVLAPRAVPVLSSTHIISGVPPSKPDFKALLKIPLGEYPVPERVRQMVDDPDQSLFDMDDPFPMDRESFHSTFSTLQYIEELQMAKDIRKYDMEAKIERGGGSFFELNEVELRKQPDRMTTRNNERSFFFLTVPGLAEARPQVLYNDRVFASIKESPEIEYEGRVHDISKETALDLARHLDDEIKFPTIAPSPTHRKILPSPLGDESPGMKELNFEQRMAVRNVVERRHGNVPYIIFGPPGTGKTMTIVECIKQSYLCSKNDPQYGRNHYLVFAPSNLAADQLVERLSDVFPANQMIRVNSYRRPGASVSDKVKQYCPRDSLHGPEMFRLPSAAEVQRYRVVVTTTVSAGLLYAMGIPRGWFTSLFMDEAGQATEPEFWIAVAGLLDASKGQLVLAGDPKQLGPIIRSPHAKRFGLNKSYLERLLELPMYTRQQPSGLLDDDDDDGGGADDVGTSRLLPSQRYVHPHAVTRLVRNYRSHPKIMAISSSLFYDRELIAQADLQMRESLADIDMLPTKGFPVVLHAVAGKDEQEGDSPSWFNADEVAVVRKWVMALMALKSKGVTGPQIGVITPYRRQVQKLEASLGRVGVKVATVEEFQGQERRIIIISTVRSSVTHVRHDELHAVGFLRNAKRFNVAVSRAKALLVVVGNPLVLERDAHWGALVRYCRSNGAVVGSDPGGGATAPGLLRHAPSAAGGDGVEGLVTDLTQRLRMAEEGTAEEEELMVQLGENDGSGVGEAQLQEDPAWRRDL